MPAMTQNKKVIRNLLDTAIVQAGGTQRKLADAIGMSQHAIYHAIKVGRVSADLAVKLDTYTKGLVSRETLRPDLFGGGK